MSNLKLKNIVVVYDYLRNVGGINPVAYEPAKLLSNSFNVYYCYADSETVPICDSITHVPLSSAADTHVKQSVRGIVSIINLTAMYHFYKLLKSLNPDETIIHFHGWGMALSGGVVWLAKRLGFNTVYTAHDYSLYCPNGVYFDFKENSDCTKKPLSISCLKTNCDKYSITVKIQRNIRGLVDKYLFRTKQNIDRVVFVSDFVLEVFQKDLDHNISHNDIVIDNPVEATNKAQGYIDNPQGSYLFVGRLTPEKGIELLCQAATELKLPLEVCGTGPIYEKLRTTYPNIYFHGWLDKKSLEKVYSKAKCLVFPSLWRETSGLVVDDAISRGLMVIASSNTGAKDKIKGMKKGYLFDKGSLSSLIKALNMCEEDQSINETRPRTNFMTLNEYTLHISNYYKRHD